MKTLKNGGRRFGSKKPKKLGPPWSKIRSDLRKRWLWSPERRQALLGARVTGTSRPFLYVCNQCRGLFRESAIDIDHKIPCGKLKEDPLGFITRLFCNPQTGLQALCKNKCHKEKSGEDRKNANTKPV